MLVGVLGFVILWVYNLSFQTHLLEDKAFIGFITSRNFLLVALLFGVIYIFFIGFSGWMNPSARYSILPLLSLVAFVFCSAG